MLLTELNAMAKFPSKQQEEEETHFFIYIYIYIYMYSFYSSAVFFR